MDKTIIGKKKVSATHFSRERGVFALLWVAQGPRFSLRSDKIMKWPRFMSHSHSLSMTSSDVAGLGVPGQLPDGRGCLFFFVSVGEWRSNNNPLPWREANTYNATGEQYDCYYYCSKGGRMSRESRATGSGGEPPGNLHKTGCV